MSDSQSHASQDVKTCLTVFPLLAALILLTVFIHQSHLPYKIQLMIELVKFCIVIGYFMHLIANRKEISNVWWMTILVVIGLLVLPIFNTHNHLIGTVDTSKELQAENQATSSASPNEEHEGNVH